MNCQFFSFLGRDADSRAAEDFDTRDALDSVTFGADFLHVGPFHVATYK